MITYTITDPREVDHALRLEILATLHTLATQDEEN